MPFFTSNAMTEYAAGWPDRPRQEGYGAGGAGGDRVERVAEAMAFHRGRRIPWRIGCFGVAAHVLRQHDGREVRVYGRDRRMSEASATRVRRSRVRIRARSSASVRGQVDARRGPSARLKPGAPIRATVSHRRGG